MKALLGLSLLVAAPAVAQDLPSNSAKAKPTIGEAAEGPKATFDGTLASSESPSSSPVLVYGGRQYFTPTPAGDVSVEYGGVKTTFGSIPAKDMGAFLSQADESIEIEQFLMGASVTAPVAGGSVDKGNYQVVYYYYRYRSIPCPGGPGSGGVAIGVGLRVTATFKSFKTNVSVSGFMPLAVAASASKVSGNIRIEQSGISSGTGSISSYLAGATDLNPESIRKAVESFGVVKAVFETPSLTLTPYYLFVDSPDIKKCLAQLVKKD